MQYILVAAFLALLSHAAFAQESGVGLICDTKEQAEQFVRTWNGNSNETLSEINQGAQPPACGIVPIAYIKGERVSVVTRGIDSYEVVAVMVVAINNGGSWVHGQPFPQFSIFKMADRGA